MISTEKIRNYGNMCRTVKNMACFVCIDRCVRVKHKNNKKIHAKGTTFSNSSNPYNQQNNNKHNQSKIIVGS